MSCLSRLRQRPRPPPRFSTHAQLLQLPSTALQRQATELQSYGPMHLECRARTKRGISNLAGPSSNGTQFTRSLSNKRLPPNEPTDSRESSVSTPKTESRVKFASTTPRRNHGLPEMDQRERKAFAQWRAAVRRGLLEEVNQPNWKPSPERAPPVLRQFLHRNNVQEMETSWQDRLLVRRKKVWPFLMRTALECCPDRARVVLEATLAPLPPGYAAQDVIAFLALWQRSLPPEEAALHGDALIDLVVRLLPLYYNRYDTRFVLHQHTIYHLIRGTEQTAKVEELYNCLVIHDHELHPNTLLQFASRFAQDPERKEVAIRMVLAMVDSGGAQLTPGPWARLCTTILSFDPDYVPGEQRATLISSTTTALEDFVERGLVPDIIHFTSLIRTLCIFGELRTAWHVLAIMRTYDIKPDAVLMCTLLQGAQGRYLSQNKIDLITSLAVEHQAINVPFFNILLSNILACSITALRRSTPPRRRLPRRITSPPQPIPAFKPMLYFYCKIFPLEPLQHLIPIDLAALAKASLPVMSGSTWKPVVRLFPLLVDTSALVTEKQPPTGATLAVMYLSYVKSLSEASSVLSLYSYLSRLIRKGDPIITRFMAEKNTMLHDAIIKRLAEFPHMLRAALDVFGDMLKSDKAGEGKPNTGGKPARSHPSPSVYTWNIVMHACMRHGQAESGERILHMMRQHGVSPNVVTWSTLLGEDSPSEGNKAQDAISSSLLAEEEPPQAEPLDEDGDGHADELAQSNVDHGPVAGNRPKEDPFARLVDHSLTARNRPREDPYSHDWRIAKPASVV
ncbi:hypothetical protein SODALDRAFT_329013 [Sodiomyces alkalinus F11]|uniref:Pentatricopeptide repeat protein n=1 Tax=Sodiomyces alkalinus (strain CBS 110278 / VKM F-3762 / F11) TaxID=1314773 RepID=A0A3N2PMB2_SODAK|nr:hypothetical protein SODALDRAFT_329013 [Sodiomyces alkalinus F11]ROT35648.1 hypothetical protein SODALDRAFT_329013 [Sodiomyces alkalinus F11]